MAWGRAIGGARWVEHALFEVVGRWSADDPCPAAATLFAVLAPELAGHAALLADRLPVLAGVDPDELTVAPPGWTALTTALDTAPSLARLAGLGRVVLPRLCVRYAQWLGSCGPSEASLRRALRGILADERHAWLAVEAVAEDLISDGTDAAAAARHVAELEACLLPSGPVGPDAAGP